MLPQVLTKLGCHCGKHHSEHNTELLIMTTLCTTVIRDFDFFKYDCIDLIVLCRKIEVWMPQGFFQLKRMAAKKVRS